MAVFSYAFRGMGLPEACNMNHGDLRRIRLGHTARKVVVSCARLLGTACVKDMERLRANETLKEDAER